jgi:flagellar basal body-associated protein FliL
MRAAKVKKANLINKTIKHIACCILMVFLSLFIYGISGLLFTGCAGKEYVEVIKTVEVKTPVKCGLSAPKLAAFTNNTLQNEANIYIYAEDLESTLKKCKGEK